MRTTEKNIICKIADRLQADFIQQNSVHEPNICTSLTNPLKMYTCTCMTFCVWPVDYRGMQG